MQEKTSRTNGKPMIETRGLSKFYGSFAAVRSVSFTVPKGQVCAFLGPNGAGKSTTMRLITGYLAPTEGMALIGGYDVATDRIEASKLIGYLPENGPLYMEMTPRSFLMYMGEARGMSKGFLDERLDYVAEKCSLRTVWGKPISKLSKGYRQRVGMAQALLHDPEVLILDEPTAGLDPNQVHDVRELIKSLGKTKTILVSTHILREVQVMCSRVIMISLGRIVLDASVADLGKDETEMEEKFRRLTLGLGHPKRTLNA